MKAHKGLVFFLFFFSPLIRHYVKMCKYLQKQLVQSNERTISENKTEKSGLVEVTIVAKMDVFWEF